MMIDHLDNQKRPLESKKPVREKWFHHRDDLTGEHAWGDAGQAIFAVLFFGVWIVDSFFLRYSTQLNDFVPPLIREPIGCAILCISAYLAWSGLRIAFGEVRNEPSVIREGVFNFVRHPIYLSEVLLYLGLLLIRMSLAAAVIWIVASGFLYYLSRYEERLLLERFGEDYEIYMRDVGMWLPRLGGR
jgi:protein-S-isoprenylcysteine O-methyltransferase Ste14